MLFGSVDSGVLREDDESTGIAELCSDTQVGALARIIYLR